LAAALQQGIAEPGRVAMPAISAPSSRKRLGKSLAQISQSAQS
jgi:hypothetical protein